MEIYGFQYWNLTPREKSLIMKDLWENKQYREEMFKSKNHVIKPKLTDKQVIEIKQSSLPLGVLANQYNVSYSIIFRIKHKQSYRWVDVPIIESKRKRMRMKRIKKNTIIPKITDPYILLIKFREWDKEKNYEIRRKSHLRLSVKELRKIANEYSISTAGVIRTTMEIRIGKL